MQCCPGDCRVEIMLVPVTAVASMQALAQSQKRATFATLFVSGVVKDQASIAALIFLMAFASICRMRSAETS